MTESLSNAEARRIALAAQGFGEKRPRGRIDRRHLHRVMNRLHLLQLDSVPVVMRTQYMPLFSRLGAYRPELLDEVAYRPHRGECAWFEAWSHEASLLPVEMEPWLRFVKQRAREGETWGRYFKSVIEDPAYLDRVRDEIKSRGPLSAGELSDPRPNQGDWWSNRSTGARALDWLFRVGELGIRRRPGFVKEFDLLDRIVPGEILDQRTPTEDESLDELLLRSARAYGIASADCLVDYFRLPVKRSKARLAGLVEDGRLVEADVEGWKPKAYLDPEARCPRSIEATALLSPFDPVVWCRKRIEGLFHFDYRIEIYVPKEKRRWGYYVLPLLVGDRLAARFDLKTHRETRILEVRAAHLEAGEDALEVAETAAGELEELARFVGADRVRVGRKGNLARTLSTALRSKGSRG